MKYHTGINEWSGMASKKKSNRFIQKATASMKRRGTLGSYGSHSVAQMKRDKAKGGKIGRKANFALNMSRVAKKRKRGGRKSSRS